MEISILLTFIHVFVMLPSSVSCLVEITSGDYGWKVDKEGEKAKILEDIKNGESYERELTYAQTANMAQPLIR